MEVNSPLFFGLRVFDENRYGNWGACALSENVVFLLAAAFARCAGVTAQVEDIQAGKFFCQTFTQSVCGSGFYPACIGYEADNALLPDAVGCPTNGADVAVVQGVFIGSDGVFGIGLADACVQMRVFDVGIIVVGGFLSCRIGRIADNDADVQGFLPFAACAVVHQHFVQHVAFFVHLEGVGQADAFKGNVGDVV